MLHDQLYPLLTGAINYYLHFLEEGNDGKLHLGSTFSPEYGTAADCNYDLSLIRWGCSTLLWINERLGLNSPREEEWENVLENLVDYPGDDSQGYYIGTGIPLEKSQRHYSHLLMIYPLYQVNIDQPGSRNIIEKNLMHWHSMPEGLRGYSFTGASSMYSALGDGNSALKMLNGLKPYLLPNTMYAERGPVIETPLSAAQSIHDMLIQSWGEIIRVFPAVPTHWEDVVFHDLRTEGAFSVSAKRVRGKTQWVRVNSLSGESFRIRPGIEGPVWISDQKLCKKIEPGLYELKLPGNAELVFRLYGTEEPMIVLPIEKEDNFHFGIQ